jgi:hypothetical protein
MGVRFSSDELIATSTRLEMLLFDSRGKQKESFE